MLLAISLQVKEFEIRQLSILKIFHNLSKILSSLYPLTSTPYKTMPTATVVSIAKVFKAPTMPDQTRINRAALDGRHKCVGEMHVWESLFRRVGASTGDNRCWVSAWELTSRESTLLFEFLDSISDIECRSDIIANSLLFFFIRRDEHTYDYVTTCCSRFYTFLLIDVSSLY